jgi:hypothetical protein
MATVPCKECGESVSSTDSTCPHCGSVLRDQQSGRSRLSLIARIAFLLIFVIPSFIAAITVEPFLAKMSHSRSNERAAQRNLRIIVDAQLSYHSENSQYAETFDELSSWIPPYLEGDWSQTKQGYVFRLGGDGDSFTINADPGAPGVTGIQFFF